MLRKLVLVAPLSLLAGLWLFGSSAQLTPEKPAPSVLVIIADTLRFDGGEIRSKRSEAAMAVPRSLQSRGRHFTGAIAAAPWTLPSITAMLTGFYPSESGVITIGDMPKLKGPSLAERLRGHGFKTAAVVSNPTLAVEGETLYIGFDTIDANTMETRAPLPFKIRSAEKTTDAALAQLETLHRGGSPWFLLVHYFEPHGPYFAPSKYLAARKNPGRPLPRAKTNYAPRGKIPAYQFNARLRGRNDYVARYRASARYVLAEVDRFLAAGYESGALADTVVVFTADHGELLGEQDYWFQHAITIDPSLVRVPLVVAKGADDPLTQEPRPVSNLDVFPTACQLLGVDGCTGTRGENLYDLPTTRRFPIVSEQGLVPGPGFDPHVAVIVNDADLLIGSPSGPTRTFRLAAQSGSPTSDRQIAAGKKVIRDHLEFIHAVVRQPRRLDPELIKKLRALGYLQGLEGDTDLPPR